MVPLYESGAGAGRGRFIVPLYVVVSCVFPIGALPGPAGVPLLLRSLSSCPFFPAFCCANASSFSRKRSLFDSFSTGLCLIPPPLEALAAASAAFAFSRREAKPFFGLAAPSAVPGGVGVAVAGAPGRGSGLDVGRTDEGGAVPGRWPAVPTALELGLALS